MRHRTNVSAPMLALCLLAATGGGMLRAADDDPPGIKVGEKAPSFRLTGHDGQEYALEDLLAKGKVALVFYRSADW